MLWKGGVEEYSATSAELETMLQQAVAVEPSPYKLMVGGTWAKSPDSNL